MASPDWFGGSPGHLVSSGCAILCPDWSGNGRSNPEGREIDVILVMRPRVSPIPCPHLQQPEQLNGPRDRIARKGCEGWHNKYGTLASMSASSGSTSPCGRRRPRPSRSLGTPTD